MNTSILQTQNGFARTVLIGNLIHTVAVGGTFPTGNDGDVLQFTAGALAAGPVAAASTSYTAPATGATAGAADAQAAIDALNTALAGLAASGNSALVDNGDGTYTHTSGSGVVQVIDIGAALTALGVGNSVNTDNGDGTVTLTSGDGTATTIDIAQLITDGSITDALVDNGDGTYTHTALDGTAVVIAPAGNTSAITDNGDGTYTHDDGTGTTAVIDTVTPPSVFVDNGDETITHTSSDGTAVTVDYSNFATPDANGKVADFQGDINVTGVIDPTKLLFSDQGGPSSHDVAADGEFQIEFQGEDLNFKSDSADDIMHMEHDTGDVSIGDTSPSGYRLKVTSNGDTSQVLITDSSPLANKDYGINFRSSGAGAFVGYNGSHPQSIPNGGGNGVAALMGARAKDVWLSTTATLNGAGALTPGDPDHVPRLVVKGITGRVGIGTTAPTADLSVNGTANNLSGSWGIFSDPRIKTNLTPVDDALSLVNKIPVYTYNHTQEYLEHVEGPTIEGEGFDERGEKVKRSRKPKASVLRGRTLYGVNADEFAAVLPEYVSEVSDLFPDQKNVDQAPLPYLAIAAIQELTAQVSSLTARLENLEASS